VDRENRINKGERVQIVIKEGEHEILNKEPKKSLAYKAAKETLKFLRQKKRLLTISFIYLDKEQMQNLNNEQRKKNEPTDVLSFPMLNIKPLQLITKKYFPNEYDRKTGKIYLGDIYICLDMVENHELILVHGLLHLFGFTHETDEDEKIMRAAEEFIVNKLKRKSR